MGNLMSIICHLQVQGAIPAVLTPQPGSKADAELKKFRSSYLGVLAANAAFTAKAIEQIDGLISITPAGAMYTMVR